VSHKIDLTGQRFGRLIAVERSASRRSRTVWMCRCDCGKMKAVTTTELRRGDTQSCGCLFLECAKAKAKVRAHYLAGQRFGRLLVVGRAAGSKCHVGGIKWLCLCDCGRECVVYGHVLRRGAWQSCGCRKRQLCAERGPRVGAIVRKKKCRTCGQAYSAVGPQKECSNSCRLDFHAADESRRRNEAATIRVASELAALKIDLEGRLANVKKT
jgi:hypothetical protein